MRFPDQKLEKMISKPRFKKNDRCIYTDKEGNEYPGTVLEVTLKTIISPWVCKIHLDEPNKDGYSNFIIKETGLKHLPKAKKTKKDADTEAKIGKRIQISKVESANDYE